MPYRRPPLQLTILQRPHAHPTHRHRHELQPVRRLFNATLQYKSRRRLQLPLLQASVRRRARRRPCFASYPSRRSIDLRSSTNSRRQQKFPPTLTTCAAERSLSTSTASTVLASSHYSLPSARPFVLRRRARGSRPLGTTTPRHRDELSCRRSHRSSTRADVAQSAPHRRPPTQHPLRLFFNPAAFVDPATRLTLTTPRTFTHAVRHPDRPGFKNFPFLSLDLRLGEGVRLLPGRSLQRLQPPELNCPSSPRPPDVGHVTATANEGRELQSALKLIF